MELILDDQVGWSNSADGLHRSRRQNLGLSVSSLALAPGPEQTMALAFLAYTAEQSPNLSAPSHHRKFVHGSDHHRRRTVVDFFIHRQYWDTWVWQIARPTSGVSATTLLVTAINHSTAALFVDDDVLPRVDLGPTPRTVGQLERRGSAGLVFAGIPHRLDRIVTLFRRSRRYFVTHPQTDGEWFIPQRCVTGRVGVSADFLHRADQRCRTLELLQSK